MTKTNLLVVSECFYSIQGEGQTMGIPAVFLRLGGCNLFCESRDWRCDTIEVWQKGKSKKFEDVIPFEFIEKLSKGAHLVLTGGEPMLHEAVIIDYLNWFRVEHKFLPCIEIETNGTIIPGDIMFYPVDYWNVSPKLSNSGMPYSRRVNEVALLKIQRLGRNKIFKFVVARDEDMLEIFEDYGMLDKGNVVLMPAGDTQDSLNIIRPTIVDLCKKFELRYCDRLQVVIFNKATGV
jgi:organic radical activating enzyme